jgi:hypothetical protein
MVLTVMRMGLPGQHGRRGDQQQRRGLTPLAPRKADHHRAERKAAEGRCDHKAEGKGPPLTLTPCVEQSEPASGLRYFKRHRQYVDDAFDRDGDNEVVTAGFGEPGRCKAIGVSRTRCRGNRALRRLNIDGCTFDRFVGGETIEVDRKLLAFRDRDQFEGFGRGLAARCNGGAYRGRRCAVIVPFMRRQRACAEEREQGHHADGGYRELHGKSFAVNETAFRTRMAAPRSAWRERNGSGEGFRWLR